MCQRGLKVLDGPRHPDDLVCGTEWARRAAINARLERVTILPYDSCNFTTLVEVRRT